MSSAAVVQFSSSAAAARLVAGLPAAARAIREAAMSGLVECWLTVGDETPLAPAVRAEIQRLAMGTQVHGLDRQLDRHRGNSFAGPDRPVPAGRVLVISGEALADAAVIRAALAAGQSFHPALRFTDAGAGDAARRPGLQSAPDGYRSAYAAASRAIIKGTAKSTDGLVSRSINRPVSQAISRFLLKFPAIRPIHATMGTAVLAVLMFAVLVLFGSPAGLVAGAILFQAASVVDGVDGEIARATYRTSDRGAMIDSLIDAATNLSFVAGIVINLAQRGRWAPAMFGIAGLAMLALGLTTLGTRARRSGAPITFDGLKGRFRDNGSEWGKWVVWLTMRDFLALASVALIVAGLTEQAIMAFSAIMAVWLVAVLTSHVRQSALGR